jgi:colanic acid biosynthesis glycosyl transferase WcaI
MTTPMPAETAPRKPRIVYLSQLFDPEPTFKGRDFIAGLVERGFEVEVVTGFPNYPGGKVYEGYKIRPLVRERMGETAITRLAMYPSHDRSALRRIACYTSFMITSFLYLTFRARRTELIYVYYPALTAGLAAIAVKLFRRTPVLLDIQDMWPDSLGSSGMMKNQTLLRIANAACNLLYRHCDHILVLSPGFKNLLVERGVAADKITVVYNWADEPPVIEDRSLPEGFDSADAFRVLFAGNMGVAQRLDTVIDAAGIVQNEHPDCVFYFMGGGIDRDRLAARAGVLGLSNVRFLPRVPLQEVQRFLTAADALLVHLTDDPLFRITIPSKTQAYLYAGRPILMGVAGDAADLVREADAGYVFPPGDAQALAACVGQLVEDGPNRREEIGRNAKTFYMERLRRSKGIGATAGLINRFRKGSRGAGLAKGVSS